MTTHLPDKTSASTLTRTCSIALRHARDEEGPYRAAVIAHGYGDSCVRELIESPASANATEASAWARAWAREYGLVVVDFSRGPIFQHEATCVQISVCRILPDERVAAIELEIYPKAKPARAGFLRLHLEDPAGILCPVLAPHRCDACGDRGQASSLLADEVYKRYGPGSDSAPQGLLWHAMAGLLYAWTVDLPSYDVRGATSAVGTLDPTRVISIDDLLDKYGTRGIGFLVKRCVDLLPFLTEGDDLLVRLGTAMADLESALKAVRHETRTPKRQSNDDRSAEWLQAQLVTDQKKG